MSTSTEAVSAIVEPALVTAVALAVVSGVKPKGSGSVPCTVYVNVPLTVAPASRLVVGAGGVPRRMRVPEQPVPAPGSAHSGNSTRTLTSPSVLVLVTSKV